MPIIVTCSNGHKLRVKDELAGKKVRCPHCQAVVQIPAAEPAEETDELSVLMESDPGTAPPARPAAPRRPAPSKARPAASKAPPARRGGPRRTKSDGSPMKLVLAIGGAAAALGILAVVAVFVLGIGRGGGRGDDVPGGIVDDRTPEQKAAAQPPTRSTQRSGQQSQQAPGLAQGGGQGPRGGSLPAGGDASDRVVAAANAQSPPQPPAIAIVRTTKAFDPQKLLAQAKESQPQQLDGTTYYRVRMPATATGGASATPAIGGPGPGSQGGGQNPFGGNAPPGGPRGAAGPGFNAGPQGAPGAEAAPELPSAPEVPHRPLDLTYVPNQAEVIISLRAAELAASPLIARLLATPQAQKSLAEMEQQLGLSISDIESLVIALPSLNDASSAAMSQAGAMGSAFSFGMAAGAARGGGLPGTPGPGGGQSPGPDQQAGAKEDEPVAVYFPDNQTAVFGTEELVQAAIRQGTSQTQRPELASFNAGHHVLIAIAPKGGLAAAAQAAPLPTNNPLIQAVMQNGTALALSFMVTDNVFAYATVPCNDQQGAAQVLAAVNNSIQQLHAVAEGMKQNLPPAITQIIDQVLASLTAKQAETTVTVTAAIPAAAFNPQIWLSLMFSGMMGPGGGPLGAPQGNPQAPGGNGSGAPRINPQAPGGAAPPGPGASSGGPSTLQETPPAAKVVADGWEKTLRLSYERPRDFLVRTKGEALFVTIDLAGAAAQSATAYGMVRVDSAKDDRGNELKPLESTSSLMNDPSEGFLAVNSLGMLGGKPNPPENRVRIHLMLDSPLPAANELATLEGSLQLGQHKEIILRGNLNRPGTKFADPALEEAGLSVQIGRDPKGFPGDPSKLVVVQVSGPTAKLLAIMLVDGVGQGVSSSVSFFQTGGVTTYSLMAQKELPSGAGLKLSVVDDETLVQVPFKFENAPLPPRS